VTSKIEKTFKSMNKIKELVCKILVGDVLHVMIELDVYTIMYVSTSLLAIQTKLLKNHDLR